MKNYIIITAIIIWGYGCSYNNTSNRYPEAPDYSKKEQNGIDFFASGNNPFWSLDVDLEDSARFYFSGESALRYAVPKPVIDTVKKSILYMFTPNTVLTVSRKNCYNSITKEKSEFTAEMLVDGKTYTGCGKYIIASKNPFLSPETLRLNDIWALKSIKGKNINKDEFNEGIPFIELHLNNGKFYGKTNCNEISGNLSTGDSHINFSGISGTKKHCEGDFEDEFLSSLRNADSWRLEKLELILRHDGEEILRFIKVD